MFLESVIRFRRCLKIMSLLSSHEQLLVKKLIQKGLLTPDNLVDCIMIIQRSISAGKKCSLASAIISKKLLDKQQLTVVTEELKNLSLQDIMANAHKIAPHAQAQQMVGQYQLRGQLGRGSMSIVYKAFDTKNQEFCALKKISSYGRNEVKDVERFKRETMAMYSLKHPNIIRIRDTQVHEGCFYLVMDYIDGRSLNSYMQQKSMPYLTVLALISKLASIVHYVHKNNIIHRDLKPQNIMFTKNFAPVLMDFGTIKVADGKTALTTVGTIMGTPLYIAPESLSANTTDFRADLYSLGAIGYELLTGRPTVGEQQDLQQIIHNIIHKLPPLPSKSNCKIPPLVDQIFMKAIAKQPQDRFQSGMEMANAIAPLLATAPPLDVQMRSVYG